MKHNLFITILLFTIACPAFSQKQDFRFDHFSTANGLSQSNVLCILQDSRGFMWFGTRDGLNRYNGYTFTVYRNIPGNNHSLTSNYINSITEDKDGVIWVSTNGGGISSYNRTKDAFDNYVHDKSNPGSLASNYVNCVFADSKGNIWAGTDGGGLDKLNRATKAFTHFTHKPGVPTSIADDFIRSMYEDAQHTLWVGTVNRGLEKFNASTNTFTHFTHDYKNPSSISNNDVYCVYDDSRGLTWVATNGGGLNLFNKKTGTFTSFQNNPHNPNSLPANSVYDVYEDEKGDLWLGTENGGLSIFNPAANTFTNYAHDDIDEYSISNNSIYSICRDTRGDVWLGTFSAGVDVINADKKNFKYYRHSTSPASLSHNKVLCIYQDLEDNVWVGTDGGGLNMLDEQRGNFTHYTYKQGAANCISGNYVLHVTEDNKSNLWIGTWADGLSVYNKQTKKFKTYKNNPHDTGSLSGNNVWYTYQDRENNIWIGTYGNGLNLYNPATDKFIHYLHNPNNPLSLGSDKVYSITEDSKGRLWIGTEGGGLELFDKKNNRFIHYLHDDNKNSISDNSVQAVVEDNDGKLWLATTNGLNYFDPETGKFTVYTSANGLPNNIIFGITQDAKGYMWISTNRGISKFDPKKTKFENFTTADGLQGDEFKEMAFYKGRKGYMYFGGNNGFNIFHPDSIQRVVYNPPLVFTDFRLFNQSVEVAANDTSASPLKQNISETKTITISYKQPVIAFQFASLNFCPAGKKRYQYKLDGFDEKWNDIGTARIANYTNLDPGTYTFRVKGLDNEGNWSANELSLTLIITPPFWKTWWFRLICIAAAAGVIIAVFRIRLGYIQRQKEALEKQVKERTGQLNQAIEQEKKARHREEQARVEAERANSAKSVFLATMSHEIRTPLNGVIGMSSLLADTELTDEQNEYATTIKSCGESLMSVINDILDFSKIESGNMELEKRDFDLRTCVEEVLDVFAGNAAKTGIDLVYEIDYNVPSQIVGDMHRLRQVLMNLVGNAIKFTHKGEVFIGVHLTESSTPEIVNICFEIRDTGIGIPPDKAHRLFKAFSQVDSSTTRKYGGTGLGLIICQKLVGLMGGTINVESRIGVGTTFFFNIVTSPSAQPQRKYVHYNNPELDGRHILIIDDNQTNRRILTTQLEQWKFIPVPAASGKEALSLLEKGSRFDLVITDMHMPEMDGVNLARQIKQLYPGLPVVLLSSIGDENPRRFPGYFNAILNKPVKQQALYRCIVHELKAKTNGEAAGNDAHTKQNIQLAQRYPLEVLIAEDNVINQRLMVHVLNKLGYNPQLADDGQQVLEKVVQSNFDMIFMDVQMPEIDGLETTRIIRRQQHVQPVIIAMTANATKEDQTECLEAGMDDYMSKPIQLNLLIAKIESWAKKRKGVVVD